MRAQHIITALFVLSMVFFFAGCGSDTAAQLKQAQDDLAKAEARIVAIEKERDTLRGDMARCAQEREQARNDLRFFAKKVNPLELANYEKERLIETLKKELESSMKIIKELKAGMDAAPPATPGAEPQVR